MSRSIRCTFRRKSRFVVLFSAFIVLTSGYYFIARTFLKGSILHHFSSKSLLIGLKRNFYDSVEQLSDIAHPQSRQACVHPKLELWPEVFSRFFKKVKPLKCNGEENWVYVENGKVRVSPKAKVKHGSIECKYTPLHRGNDDWKVTEGATSIIEDGHPMISDFFKVQCKAADGKLYSNLHSGIAYNSTKKSRSHKTPLPKNSLGLSVLMFGFDSVSRMTWMRNLPKSHKYFTDVLKGMVLQGYNIVGDGTPQALLPILTGKTELELPEARRGKPGASTVDGHPWIWKDFENIGYVSQYGEDGASFGTFHYRMLGFKNSPVDHYMRPFYNLAEKLYSKNKPYCLGSLPRHQNMMNWIRDFYQMYKDEPKFSFLFHSEFTHGYTNELQKADNDLKTFLESLYSGGYLNNTIIILMADHGARFHDLRQTVQGKVEERMPYFGFRFPSWFAKRYPDAFFTFKNNIHKLTTPFDIHETFMDIVKYSGGGKGDVKHRGISLFKEIPRERTCSDAGIEAHWCACLNWKDVNTTGKLTKRAVKELISEINNLILSQKNLCAEVVLDKVISVVKYEPNRDLLKFKGSADLRGFKPDMSDKMNTTEILYQVTIKTKPAAAIFEATIKYFTKQDKFKANEREISRINKYGTQPHCVMEHLPHLRPYCYCRKQIKS